MTPDPVRDLISTQQLGGGYNRNAARLILGQPGREDAQGAVDALTRELGLEAPFGLTPGTGFGAVGRAAAKQEKPTIP